MDKRGWMMLRVLINRYNPEAGHEVLKFLPQEDIQKVMAQDIHSNDLTPIFQQHQRFLEKIHYSWVKPLLQKFPNRLQPAVISALTNEQIAGLRVSKGAVISYPVKSFILDKLYHLLKVDEYLPLEYLPETELSPLAKWSKSRLIHLFDFLGLYDLASEIRHIVNRDYLKNIYSCLSPQQHHYLKVCLHQKEQIIAPKLGIDPSKQDCTALKQILHRRGLLRFGLALCGQHPDLIWHIAHTLDTGRGEILLKDYQQNILPKITPVLKQQVLNLMNFLKASNL